MSCCRRKSTVKLENQFFKKTPKNDLFEWQEIGITSLWEDLDDKLLTPGQLLPAVNLAYIGTLYVYPVTRQIFRNILGINWQY